jgi:hypothetical protein
MDLFSSILMLWSSPKLISDRFGPSRVPQEYPSSPKVDLDPLTSSGSAIGSVFIDFDALELAKTNFRSIWTVQSAAGVRLILSRLAKSRFGPTKVPQ